MTELQDNKLKESFRYDDDWCSMKAAVIRGILEVKDFFVIY